MTFDQIITLTLNRCGARSGSTDLNTHALTELQLIQERLEEEPELPWFLLSESSTTATSSGEPRVAVPSDYLIGHEDSDLWLEDGDGDWAPLIKIEYDRVKTEFVNDDNATPTHYALRGGYFYLGPTPDAAYNLRMVYHKADDAPALGTENQWAKYASDLLIAELGVVIAGQYLSDFDKMTTFEKALVRAKARLDAKNIARDEINQLTEMRD